MPGAAEHTTPDHPQPRSRADLFWSFTWLALQGFGGVLAVVQREIVEKKRWLTREEFVEDWAVAQILPGPNVVNLSLMIGARSFGLSGAMAALAGMLSAPRVVVLVIIWTSFKIALIGQSAIPWPGLHNAIAITLYDNKPYAAIWSFQPLATGTAILVSTVTTAAIFRVSPAVFLACVRQTIGQAWLAVLTVMFIVGLAYLMNYAGLAYTLGKAVASTGHIFVLLSPVLGWIAVFLSGSDTSGNALFGNLQVVAARQLGLSPVLFAATNSSGGVMGKMISPQNIATGVSVTDLKGQEGVVFARTFWHSVILTLILGLLVAAQQYLFPGVIPGN